MATGLMLHRFGAGKHSRCEFMSAGILSHPEARGLLRWCGGGVPGCGGAGDFYSFQVWCSLGGGSEMGILGLLSV